MRSSIESIKYVFNLLNLFSRSHVSKLQNNPRPHLKTLHSKTVTLCLFSALLVGFCSDIQAQSTPDCSSPDVICIGTELPFSPGLSLSQPGKTYLLTKNESSSGAGITINADNITLDGRGFAITLNSASGSQTALRVFKNNAVLRNLNFKREIAGSGAALEIFQSSNATGSIIHNNTFEGKVSLQGADGCHLHHNTLRDGISVGNQSMSAENNLIEHNTFESLLVITHNAIAFANGNNNTFRNNHVNYITEPGGPGMKFLGSSNNKFLENYFSFQVGHSWLFSLRDESNNNLFERNTFISSYRGFGVGRGRADALLSYGNIFRANIFIADTDAFHVASTADLLLERNLIWAKNQALNFLEGSDRTLTRYFGNTIVSTDGYPVLILPDGPGFQAQFKNNILVAKDKPPFASYNTLAEIDMDHDLFYRQDASSQVVVWQNQAYASLEAFKAAQAQELHGLNLDPQFKNAGPFDYKLQSTSPALDQGELLNGIHCSAADSALDQVEAPCSAWRGSAPDLGAFEFESAPPITPAPELTPAPEPDRRTKLVILRMPAKKKGTVGRSLTIQIRSKLKVPVGSI